MREMSFTSDFDPQGPVSPLQAASRFDPYFDVYGLSLKQHADLGQRIVTLIARSPVSPPAQALAINLGRFRPLSIEVRIILAQIGPANGLNLLMQALSACCRSVPETAIRWAKNRALLDAHERLTLGRSLCWTGDAMRRAEDSRSAIDRVDDGTPAIVAEASASFEALWCVSKPLPNTAFCRGGAMEFDRPLSAPVNPDSLAVEPNIIRFGDYQRLRRH
jgi:hypothetical protein